MPGMNGIEVLREIRRRNQNLPVIIITAYGTIERAVEAVKAGANDFITKPFDPGTSRFGGQKRWNERSSNPKWNFSPKSSADAIGSSPEECFRWFRL